MFSKLKFESIGNFAHTTEFLTLRKALLILLPLYFKMLIMQISTQADNHKYRRKCCNWKPLFKKMGLKFRNPNFNILCKIAFIFFNKMPTLWSSEVNRAILGQVIMVEYLSIYLFIYLFIYLSIYFELTICKC